MKFNCKNILLIFLLILNNLVYADKIAVATKVKGMVEIMKVGNKEFKNLNAGSILDDGDKIRTGKSGFVAIIFIDDKSTLKIKENSEAVITGRRTTKDISKKNKYGWWYYKSIHYKAKCGFCNSNTYISCIR